MKTEAIESFPTASDVLKRAREHLTRGWCQKALARNKGGQRVSPYDPTATQMCAIGALVLAETELGIGPDLYEKAVRKLAGTVTTHLVSPWWANREVVMWNNDRDRTQEEVLAAFDRAAEGK